MALLLCLFATMAVPGEGLGAVQVQVSAVQQIFQQCTSGHLSGAYTVGELQQALSAMPAAVSEYTSCPDVVQTAIVNTQHHRGADTPGRSAGSFLPLAVVAVLAVLVASAGTLGIMALRRR
jgi:hypothetical protein